MCWITYLVHDPALSGWGRAGAPVAHICWETNQHIPWTSSGVEHPRLPPREGGGVGLPPPPPKLLSTSCHWSIVKNGG